MREGELKRIQLRASALDHLAEQALAEKESAPAVRFLAALSLLRRLTAETYGPQTAEELTAVIRNAAERAGQPLPMQAIGSA